MSRTFQVGPTGLTREVKINPKKALKQNRDSFLEELREEEAGFLKEFKSCEWFQDLLKKMDMTEQEWLENQIKAEIAFIERAVFCPYCEKLFEKEPGYDAEEMCFPCAKKILKIIKNHKTS